MPDALDEFMADVMVVTSDSLRMVKRYIFFALAVLLSVGAFWFAVYVALGGMV